MSMRFLLALATAAVPAALAAQRSIPNVSTAPRVGIMAGVNSSTFGGSDAASPDRRTGFIGGAYLTIPLGAPLVAFRPEVLFSQQGAKQASDGLTADVRLGYLEVPLLLQAAIPTNGRVRPRVYAGPSLAFRTSCRATASVAGIAVDDGLLPSRVAAQSTTSITTGCTDSGNGIDLGVKSFDLGGVVGGQINVDVGGHALGVGARYTHGFSDVTKFGSVKNRTVSVYGSLELPFGR